MSVNVPSLNFWWATAHRISNVNRWSTPKSTQFAFNHAGLCHQQFPILVFYSKLCSRIATSRQQKYAQNRSEMILIPFITLQGNLKLILQILGKFVVHCTYILDQISLAIFTLCGRFLIAVSSVKLNRTTPNFIWMPIYFSSIHY